MYITPAMKQVIEKISQGQEVFFKSDFHEAVFRTSEAGTFVKFQGTKEFKAIEGSKVVADGLAEDTEISKAEYESF